MSWTRKERRSAGGSTGSSDYQPACPDRHLRAAALLGAGHDLDTVDEPERLPRVLADLMRDIGLPPGLAAVGYRASDVDDLVAGAMKQQRLLATAPRAVTADDLAAIFRDSLDRAAP